MASVGTHIKRLRAAKRMTQEELAEQLHVTRQAVSAWETGKALPDVEPLERIAAALDADVTEVSYGEGGRGEVGGKKGPGAGGPEAGMDPRGDWLGALAGDPLLCPVLLRRVGQLDPWPFLPVF